MATASKNLSLISGLTAIGNIAYEKYSDLEQLNAELMAARQQRTPEKELLETYAPLYNDACKKHELLDTKLGKAWKTRAKGHGKQSLTIGDLFELIPSTSQEP